MDKIPGSSNPPSPLQQKGFNGMSGMTTLSPKVDYAMNKPLQATSPMAMEVDSTMDTHPLPIGEGVQGVINTEDNANVGSTATGHTGSFNFGVG